MDIQVYSFDKVGKPDANGATPLYSRLHGGETLAGIRNCPCAAHGPHMVYVTGQPDSFYSIPAAIKVGNKRIVGFITTQDDDTWLFTAASGR